MHKCNLCLSFSCQIGYRVESWWILARSPKVSPINDVISFFYLFGPHLNTILLLSIIYHTNKDSFCKWTKISSLEINIFGFKNDVEKWSEIYFEIHQAPSVIPANLPGQISPNGQIFWHCTMGRFIT